MAPEFAPFGVLLQFPAYEIPIHMADFNVSGKSDFLLGSVVSNEFSLRRYPFPCFDV